MSVLAHKLRTAVWNNIPKDYEAEFGTPDYTITSFPSTQSGTAGGVGNDALIAIDATIGTNNGLLMEAGGLAAGLSIGTANGNLRVRGYGGGTNWTSIDDTLTAYLGIDISAYTGTFCTYYFAFDTSNSSQLKAYVQIGGKGSTNELIPLGTNSATSNTVGVYGSGAKGYGQVNVAAPDINGGGSLYMVNYTGTIDEIRYWAEDAALDVSTFETL